MLDGVFTEDAEGALTFHAAPAPSDAEVAAALATIRHRVQRLLVRHGLEPADDATGPADRLAEESPVLAGIVGASVQGRVALGHRAGARVRRLGDARDTEAVTSRGARQAHLEGFDLHANVWVSGNDRAGLERLCRYILRPPFAQERLRRRSDGRIALELKTAWHDGTRELVFEPLELLERLAAMTPRPETNLLICHGLLAARARWRARVVAYGRVAAEPTALAPALVAGAEGAKAKTRFARLELGGVDAPRVRAPDQLQLTPGRRPRRSGSRIPSIPCSGRRSTSSCTGTTGVRIGSTTVMAGGLSDLVACRLDERGP